MEWKNVEQTLPDKAVRVWVAFGVGMTTCGKLTNNGWLDDNSLPIIGVTHWAYIVAPSATA